ncbi:cache domain-containing protein [Desulfococcaceae bacterium HSG8]|nr:cache domain-containing protein [Desulfococcaceae bacterium HSG8]
MKQMCFSVLVFFLWTSGFALAGDKATPEDVIKKVYEAATFLSQNPDDSALESFNEKNGSWVFKDTYVFVFDCGKGTIIGHPVRPQLIGRPLMGLKDTRGNYIFVRLCESAQKPKGGWVEYWWPKVGEEKTSRKVSFMTKVPGTPYSVGAGIYDENKPVEELEKLLR